MQYRFSEADRKLQGLPSKVLNDRAAYVPMPARGNRPKQDSAQSKDSDAQAIYRALLNVKSCTRKRPRDLILSAKALEGTLKGAEDRTRLDTASEVCLSLEMKRNNRCTGRKGLFIQLKVTREPVSIQLHSQVPRDNTLLNLPASGAKPGSGMQPGICHSRPAGSCSTVCWVATRPEL
jgi:hypothetical protein